MYGKTEIDERTQTFTIKTENKEVFYRTLKYLTKQYKNGLMTTLAEQSEQFITNLSEAKLSHMEKIALGKRFKLRSNSC